MLFYFKKEKNKFNRCINVIIDTQIRNSRFNTPFLANVPILYPLKISENLCFCGVFRGYKMGTLTRNGLKVF